MLTCSVASNLYLQFCRIWSVSTVFAQACLSQYLDKYGSYIHVQFSMLVKPFPLNGLIQQATN